MSHYNVVRTEIVPGTLEDFRALMHDKTELQPEFGPEWLYLQGEKTPSDYPKHKGRWEVTLGDSLQQRGYILARQLPNGTTELKFAYRNKFESIGPDFHVTYAGRIIEHMGAKVSTGDSADEKRGPKVGTLERVAEAHRLAKSGMPVSRACQTAHTDTRVYYQWCAKATGEEPIVPYFDEK